jgi:hypothetical protein
MEFNLWEATCMKPYPHHSPAGVPELPSRPSAPVTNGRGSWLSLFLAALLAGAVGAVLLVLSLGQLLPVIVIGGVIFLATAFHYLVWGWWLGKMIQQEAAEDERESGRL